MQKLIIPSEPVVHRTVTTLKRLLEEYMMITTQQRIITMTDPREAKEIDLPSIENAERTVSYAVNKAESR